MGEVTSSRTARAAIRRGVKQLAANGLHRTGARRVLVRASRRAAEGTRALVVGYHRIVPDFEALRDRVIPSLLTSTTTFERQLALLSRSYRIVPLEDVVAVLAGRSSGGRDVCAVTFDDGYADFAEHALPVLRRLGIPATLYVATGHVGTSTPLLHDRLYRLLRRVARAGLTASAFDPPVEAVT
ncbi:MAG: polysaccharide deacetylase family protein, partial [Actinomycetota bacterium]|nr:polysaccharide deacetylase family protein [Actinomycetota bacterium]